MKRIILIISAIIALATVVRAQVRTSNDKTTVTLPKEIYLWPIKNAKAGSEIVSQPQSYIDRELNFADIFVSAPLGTVVVAPCDGTITSVMLSWKSAMHQSSSFSGIGTLGSFEKDSLEIVRRKGSFDKYTCLSIGISTKKPGETIWISGVRAVRMLKTGEKIKKGDILGTVGYSFAKIPGSSIEISISQDGKNADPMTPFGLKTTFIPPQARTKTSLTEAGAKQDYKVLCDALLEGYPGLFDYISEADWAAYTQKISASLKAMKIKDFRPIVAKTLHKIADSHLILLSAEEQPGGKFNSTMPSINWGWIGGKLIVTNVLRSDSSYFGKEIVAIDGIPADNLKKQLVEFLSGFDGFNESRRDYALAGTWALYSYIQNVAKNKQNYDMTLKFADGTSKLFAGIPATREWSVKRMHSFGPFYRINWYGRDKHIQLKRLADGVAYLGINSFELNDVEQEELRSYYKRLSDSASYYHTLVIDVRNNGGGIPNLVTELYAFIAEKPFKMGVYSMVNKVGNFYFFKNTNNYAGITDTILWGFKPIEGKKGLYDMDDAPPARPDSLHHFGGKVFVLTNENSVSAATEFPALVHNFKRGTIVGRETGSCYYLINAVKFAQLRLPNSWISINIPLVKVVFNEYTPQSDIPWGRGVIPDINVPISLDELIFTHGDAILNQVLKEL